MKFFQLRYMRALKAGLTIILLSDILSSPPKYESNVGRPAKSHSGPKHCKHKRKLMLQMRYKISYIKKSQNSW